MGNWPWSNFSVSAPLPRHHPPWWFSRRRSSRRGTDSPRLQPWWPSSGGMVGGSTLPRLLTNQGWRSTREQGPRRPEVHQVLHLRSRSGKPTTPYSRGVLGRKRDPTGSCWDPLLQPGFGLPGDRHGRCRLRPGKPPSDLVDTCSVAQRHQTPVHQPPSQMESTPKASPTTCGRTTSRSQEHTDWRIAVPSVSAHQAEGDPVLHHTGTIRRRQTSPKETQGSHRPRDEVQMALRPKSICTMAVLTRSFDALGGRAHARAHARGERAAPHATQRLHRSTRSCRKIQTSTLGEWVAHRSGTTASLLGGDLTSTSSGGSTT